MVELEPVVVAGTSALGSGAWWRPQGAGLGQASPTYRRGAASHCSHGWRVFRAPPSLQCYGASAGIRVVLAGPQTQLAGPQTPVP